MFAASGFFSPVIYSFRLLCFVKEREREDDDDDDDDDDDIYARVLTFLILQYPFGSTFCAF